LVNRAIRVARKIQPPAYLVLSTDDKKIIRRYRKKVDLCIERKNNLSTSESLISDVILDVLQNIEGISDSDIFLLLEPSSPNRTSKDINEAIKILIENNYESLATVSTVDAKYHPYKILKSTDGLYLDPFMTNVPIIHNRQQIKDLAFFRNGIAYLYKISVARKLNKSIPDKTGFMIIDRPVSNIDHELDLWLARYFNFKSFFRFEGFRKQNNGDSFTSALSI
jgi:CMP-N-acetylneuraminic acid synthetase